MHNIFIKKDYYDGNELEFIYSLDSQEFNYSVTYKLGNLKTLDNGLSITTEPHLNAASKFERIIFDEVNEFLLSKIRNVGLGNIDNLKEEYKIPFDGELNHIDF